MTNTNKKEVSKKSIINVQGFDQKTLKTSLISLKTDASKIEGITRLTLIASEFEKLINHNKSNTDLIDEKTGVIKKSKLIAHAFELASYDKKLAPNGTFENMVTHAIELSLMLTSANFKKAQVKIKDNKIIVPSNINQPKLPIKSGTDGKTKTIKNPNTDDTSINISDMRAIFKDFSKSENETQNREARMIKTKNLATELRTKFKELETFLIDNFSEMKKSGQSIWLADTISTQLSQNLIGDILSNAGVINSFIVNAQKSFINDNVEGVATTELGLVRDDKIKLLVQVK